jgi:hypothetical protein
VPGNSLFILLASVPATTAFFLSLRFRFLVFEVKMWLEWDLRLASLPLAVFLNLLAADLLVLALGTIHLLSNQSPATAGCILLFLESHTADRTAVLTANPAFLLCLLKKHLKGGAGLILDQDPVFFLVSQ